MSGAPLGCCSASQTGAGSVSATEASAAGLSCAPLHLEFPSGSASPTAACSLRAARDATPPSGWAPRAIRVRAALAWERTGLGREDKGRREERGRAPFPPCVASSASFCPNSRRCLGRLKGFSTRIGALRSRGFSGTEVEDISNDGAEAGAAASSSAATGLFAAATVVALCCCGGVSEGNGVDFTDLRRRADALACCRNASRLAPQKVKKPTATKIDAKVAVQRAKQRVEP